jgi:serine/threonine protein kinase
MHDAGFVHCDLKPQNVLIDIDQYGMIFCCLTDFGITQIVDDSSLLVKDFQVMNIRGLSTHYAAPEALQRYRARVAPETVPGDIVMKTDLYSLGIIFCELLERRKPWQE